MKLRMAAMALGLCLASAAQAAFLGVLVKSSSTSSISGKLVWVCIYEVQGQKVEVVQERMCETTKLFE